MTKNELKARLNLPLNIDLKIDSHAPIPGLHSLQLWPFDSCTTRLRTLVLSSLRFSWTIRFRELLLLSLTSWLKIWVYLSNRTQLYLLLLLKTLTVQCMLYSACYCQLVPCYTVTLHTVLEGFTMSCLLTRNLHVFVVNILSHTCATDK